MVLKYSKIMSINHYFLYILSTRATLKFPHKLKAALNCIYRKGMVLFGATQLNPRLKPISNEPFVKSNKTVFPLDFWSKSPSNFTHPFIQFAFQFILDHQNFSSNSSFNCSGLEFLAFGFSILKMTVSLVKVTLLRD